MTRNLCVEGRGPLFASFMLAYTALEADADFFFPKRAFRQRKEGYIKKLEQQVRELGEIDRDYRSTMADNLRMRDYIQRLQSALVDVRADVPQPPQDLDLDTPRTLAPPTDPALTGSGMPVSSLEAVAQTVDDSQQSDRLSDTRLARKGEAGDGLKRS